MVHCIERGHIVQFPIKICISLMIVFTLANSADPDEMHHYAAFHLVYNCLAKYTFRSHSCKMD